MNWHTAGIRFVAVALPFLLSACGGGTAASEEPLSSSPQANVAMDFSAVRSAPQTTTDLPLKDLSRERVKTISGQWLSLPNKPLRVSSNMPNVPAALWQPPEGSTPEAGNYIYLISDFQASLVTDVQGPLLVSADGPHLAIQVGGNPAWDGHFKAPRGQKKWATGFYEQLAHYPRSTPARGSLDWHTSVQGCDIANGWLAVDHVSYVEERLVAIDLRFEQHCVGSHWPVQGKLSWRDSEAPGPTYPAPTNLWQPAPDATPASGNYVYLKSEPGDYIGNGETFTYTQRDAVLEVSEFEGLASIRVNGDTWWDGDFKAMNGVSRLRPGHYPMLQRYPFHDPNNGGLNWSGSGRGCNTLFGWFVVDSISYGSNGLKAIDLRFEQHCEGWSSALRGKIHWRDDDTSAPPGPQFPIPAGLWTPEPGATPASGPFIYFKSEPGDYVGQGRTWLYTPSNANLRFLSQQSGVQVNVRTLGESSTWWSGNFAPMSTLNKLVPGYYGDLLRFPFHNPTRGGLDWSGDGRGCSRQTGWFVVDNVVYSGDLLTAISLRFEQHCEAMAPALRGQIHWTME